MENSSGFLRRHPCLPALATSCILNKALPLPMIGAKNDACEIRVKSRRRIESSSPTDVVETGQDDETTGTGCSLQRTHSSGRNLLSSPSGDEREIFQRETRRPRWRSMQLQFTPLNCQAVLAAGAETVESVWRSKAKKGNDGNDW
ncbi:hypothetical protein B0H16DRAFT_1475294 [Mycena metata]|uniref:Uncharacterized protein n=1 Tax=Mycena metata TaxID=1033252 RepID=A0AAD7HEU0_9AGAR|nr:hypothetical protein B0H16DRAFT_1475294 [Mycena metata]